MNKGFLFWFVYWFCYPFFRLHDLLSDVAAFDLRKNVFNSEADD